MTEASITNGYSDISKHTPMMLARCMHKQPEALHGAGFGQSGIVAGLLLHTL